MVWFWYLEISYQVFVIEKDHSILHLNFCFYFEVFQSTYQEFYNCEATIITVVSRLPQATVQISKDVYGLIQLLNVLAQWIWKVKERSF